MKKCRFLTVVGGFVCLLSCFAGAGENELILKDGKWVKQPAPAVGTPAGEIAMLRQLVNQKKSSKAVDLAEKFTVKYPDSPLNEQALILGGQAEMNRDRFWQAYEWYEKYLTRYPSGEFYERALNREYEIGEAFLKGKKRLVFKILWLPAEPEGIEILNRVAEHAPSTAIAEQSLLRIAQFHTDKKEYTEAVQAYDHYLSLFPKAPKASFAMLRAARAMYASYRGPEFDEVPLVDSQTRFREFAQRYPITAGQEGVNEMLRLIHAGRGQRYYVTAQFYERTHHNDSALFYFKRVISEYGDTDWANKAKTDLLRLGGKTGPVVVAPQGQPLPAATTAPAAAKGKEGGKS